MRPPCATTVSDSAAEASEHRAQAAMTLRANIRNDMIALHTITPPNLRDPRRTTDDDYNPL